MINGDILIVGTGSIGRRHIQCLKELGASNICICDPDKDNRALTENLYSIESSFVSLDEALERDYDVAIVAAPNHLHSAIACKIIKKGIDLIIEKPIEINIENAYEIQKKVIDNNVICLVAYCLRFDPVMQQIQGILKSGSLGKIYSADISVGQYLPEWRPDIDYRNVYSAKKSQGGGVCLDLSHEFDYFRWLFGEVKEVKSFAGKISALEIDVEDICESILVCEKGTVGRIHLDYLSRMPRRRLYINGSEGIIEYDFISSELKVYQVDSELCKYKRFNIERNVLFKSQLKHFFDCVKERKQPMVTVDDAIRTLKLAIEIRG